MSKHTPGPWTAYQRDGEKGTNYFRILLHGFTCNQSTYGQDSLTGYCGEANANLIAAAPDLLESLEYCLDWFCDDIPLSRLKQFKTAIARAKGETP